MNDGEEPKARRDRGEKRRYDRVFQSERSEEASPLLIARTCSSYSLFVARRVVSGPSGRTIRKEEEGSACAKKRGKRGREGKRRKGWKERNGGEKCRAVRCLTCQKGNVIHILFAHREPIRRRSPTNDFFYLTVVRGI